MCSLLCTMYTELLSAESLTVVGVTSTTALFRWEYDATNNVHGIQFSLSCSGVQQYRDKDGELVEVGADIEHKAFSNSHGWDAYYASELEPNAKYSCQVNSLAGEITGESTAHLSFKTHYAGRPEELTMM